PRRLADRRRDGRNGALRRRAPARPAAPRAARRGGDRPRGGARRARSASRLLRPLAPVRADRRPLLARRDRGSRRLPPAPSPARRDESGRARAPELAVLLGDVASDATGADR